MPDFEAAYDAILARFKAQFVDALHPTNVPVAWPNLEFDPAVSFVPATHVAWARVTIEGGGSGQASLQGPNGVRWRTTGQVVVQVFAPEGAGANVALGVADDVATALRGITTAGVILKAPTILPVGRDPDGPWFQVNVKVPFRFDLTA